jgi:hypothetical protein
MEKRCFPALNLIGWMRMAPGKRKIVLLQLACLCLATFLRADLETFGYYENRSFLFSKKEFSLEEADRKFSLGNYNRLRLQFKSALSERISLNLAVDFFTFHGTIRNLLGTSSRPEDAPWTNTELDRAYVDLYFPGFDVTIGKQRVAFGISYLWAPLDVFNRINIFEPKEEKPGVNALKVYVPLGEVSSLTGVFAPEDSIDDSLSGLRIQTLVKDVDIALNVIRRGNREETILGVDLRGEHIIGWWVEGGYFFSPSRDDVKIAIGFDYTFPLGRGLIWLNEVFFDESGEKNSALYDFSKVLAGDRFTLGEKYCLSSLLYSLSDLISMSTTYIGSWTDGSFILNPSLQYELAQNVLLNSGLFLFFGRKGGEFHPQEVSDILYIWLKVNF